MLRVGLLSDTHGFIDPAVFTHFKECDEIWHAGDFGDESVSSTLSGFKPLRGVYGNIDGTSIRVLHPKNQLFSVEGLKVFITHIGGYPGNYSKEAKEIILSEHPGIFISGHSHILKVMPDKQNRLLHMNPGAAGNHGFHSIKTMLRFSIDNGKISSLEVIELGKRGAIGNLS
jgi:putative phosphoesterase